MPLKTPHPANYGSPDDIDRQLAEIRQRENPQPESDRFAPDLSAQTIRLIKIGLSTLCALSITGGLLALGYANTDFDPSGTAYVIPLDLHKERAYIVEADKTLTMIYEYDVQFEEDARNYTTDVYASGRINEFSQSLLDESNRLARLTSVPDKFKEYHQRLINFCINMRTFIQNISARQNQEDFADFIQNGLRDYEDRLNTLQTLRDQIDADLYRNVQPEHTLQFDLNNKDGDDSHVLQ